MSTTRGRNLGSIDARSSLCTAPSQVRTVGLPKVSSTGELGVSAVKSSGCAPACSTSSQRVSIQTLTAGTNAGGS